MENEKRKLKNVNDLYHLVQNWFRLYPGTQIPHASWTRKLEKFGIEYGHLIIATRDHKVVFDNPAMIPVYAAISLDASTDDLSKIIADHHVHIGSLRNCNYFPVAISESTEKTQPEAKIPLDSYRVSERVVNAFMHLPSEINQMMSIAKNPVGMVTHETVMALLNSEHPELWPNTHIEAFFEDLQGKVETPPNQAITSYFFKAGAHLQTTADTDIRKLLFRGGLLNPLASGENGYENPFFRQIFDSKNYPVHGQPSAIIRAINSVEDPVERDMIATKLIAVMSENDFDGVDGHEIADSFFSKLSASKYPDVINSLVLKINLIPRSGLTNMPTAKMTAEMMQVSADSLLSTLGTEVMAVRKEDMRAHHFTSLGKLAADVTCVQDLGVFDLTALISHVAESLEAYLNAPSPVDRTSINGWISVSAGRFLQYAASLQMPEYERLGKINSASKALLAINGFDIKKLSSDMKNQDKGRVLVDHLGL